jgi:hypothetical protein
VKTPAIFSLLMAGMFAASCAVTATAGAATATPGQASAHTTSPAPCQTKNLYIGASKGSSGAGSYYGELRFTNTGTSTCSLTGYPGVSFTTRSHHQIGRSAHRVHGRVHVITLKPGWEASALYRLTNPSLFPGSACHQKTSAYIKVYPPNQTAPVYVPKKARLCSTSKGRPGVYRIVPGHPNA